MGKHDSSYKQFFSYPQLVADLLRDFVPNLEVDKLDFDSLEKVSGSYISDDLRDREDDVIWKIRYHDYDDWLYIYLLMEFQSTIDHFMAVRIMTYIGLLYQDLIKADVIKKKEKLPPILPLVLYNGKKIWNAPQNITELLHEYPAGLKVYQPSLQYFLIDERHDFTNEQLNAKLHSIVAILFQLEKVKSNKELRETLKRLNNLLKKEDSALLKIFVTWLRIVRLPRHLPNVTLPEFKNLQELQNMLAIETENWLEQSRKQGLQEGLQEGLQKGLQKGRQEGLQKGRQEGEITLFINLLTAKFGQLDEQTINMIQKLPEERLLECSQRLLFAKTLAEIFD